MIVYNTTYHVERGYEQEFLSWIRTHYLPHATADNTLSAPRLTRIMSDSPEQEGTSYSLQYRVASVNQLNEWYKRTGVQLTNRLTAHFGQRVVGFTTLLEEVDI